MKRSIQVLPIIFILGFGSLTTAQDMRDALNDARPGTVFYIDDPGGRNSVTSGSEAPL
jgi:hypothetical protein